MDIRNSYKKVVPPKLEPDWEGEYSYLRFISKPKAEWVEIHLPNDESYVVGYPELKMFLKNSHIEKFDKLMDMIYNFGCVLWHRYGQRFFPETRDKLLTKAEADSLRHFI